MAGFFVTFSTLELLTSLKISPQVTSFPPSPPCALSIHPRRSTLSRAEPRLYQEMDSSLRPLVSLLNPSLPLTFPCLPLACPLPSPSFPPSSLPLSYFPCPYLVFFLPNPVILLPFPFFPLPSPAARQTQSLTYTSFPLSSSAYPCFLLLSPVYPCPPPAARQSSEPHTPLPTPTPCLPIRGGRQGKASSNLVPLSLPSTLCLHLLRLNFPDHLSVNEPFIAIYPFPACPAVWECLLLFSQVSPATSTLSCDGD